MGLCQDPRLAFRIQTQTTTHHRTFLFSGMEVGHLRFSPNQTRFGPVEGIGPRGHIVGRLRFFMAILQPCGQGCSSTAGR